MELIISQLLTDISFLLWLREIEGSPSMPIPSPARDCSSAFPLSVFFLRKHICYLEILAFTQQRF